jgi:UDP-N-acetylmuramate dehydrogenase
MTTLRLGGSPRHLVSATTDAELVDALRGPSAEGVFLLGGGSNVVVSDDGFDGLVVRVVTKGIRFEQVSGRTHVTVAAGEVWDDLVAACVDRGLSGLTCLSGIPGSVGATPLQNVGAYGSEVSDTIVSVRVCERATGAVASVPASECAFGYRTSRFRGSDTHAVLAVTFALTEEAESLVPDYAELRGALGVGASARVPLETLRDTILRLRRAKGMVLDPNDPDSVSAGSFFTNPLLTDDDVVHLRARVRAIVGDVEPPLFPDRASGLTKSSAAWLIERAGFRRGYGEGRVGLSTKHTLALVNRGGASAEELVAFARHVRDGVAERFGVVLEPEPIFVGFRGVKNPL